ncbi:MAG: hypothetical protein LBK94_06730 [Prevotellaceae bacterium]|jgi:hypothetical protein|nr:hypothetical protein [Prevotellaceae bacterium]
MTYLEQINTLSPEIIEDFRVTGQSEAISAELKEFILQIDASARVLRFESNITRAAQKLRLEFPLLNFHTAKSRIYDALSFFYLDMAVSQSVWDNYYADKYEDLAKICIAADKLDAAKRNFDKAHELRTRASAAINPDMIKAPVFIITAELKPEDLGFESRKMYDIARKDEEGQYLKLIDGLNTADDNKQRLRKDANIQDIDFEEQNDG